jgi:deferrochelatase/peroxidase EfeB
VRGYARPAAHDQNEDDEHPGSRIVDADRFLLGEGSPGLMRDGSFQVFRRLAQNVPGFLAQLVHTNGSLPPEEQMNSALLAAKLIGRWPSGTPVALAPIRDYRPTDSKGVNEFSYQGDENGLRTPLFAHIRRQNERNADADAYRILRRGIPYGPMFDPVEDQGGGYQEDAGRDRGLCFNAFMSSIEDQFEYLQRERVNGEEGGGSDSVVFTNKTERRYDLYRIGGSRQKITLRSYVRTTGAVYAFAPSLGALRALAIGDLDRLDKLDH